MNLLLPQLDPLICDNSILRTTATCSTKLVLEMILGVQAVAEVAALESGRAAHEALAVWLSTGGDDAAGLTAFRKAYQTWAEANLPSGDRLSYQNTSQILAAWFKRTPYGQLPYTVDQVEVGFRVPLAPGIDMVGLLDAVGRAKTGGLRLVVEHKTTGALTAWWVARWMVDSQITGYDWGASQQLGEQITMTYVNAIEFKKLPSSNRLCKDHGTHYEECGPLHTQAQVISVTRTAEQVKLWQADAIRLAKRYKKWVEKVYLRLLEYLPVTDHSHEILNAEWGEVQALLATVPQEGTFTAACQFCSFNEFCRTGRRHRGMLVSKPWDPAAHAKLRPLEVA